MGAIITCCKDCHDRFPGCHGSCEKYKKQRAEYDALKRPFVEKGMVRQGLEDEKYRSVERAYKHRGRKIGRVRY
jgi:hypothetical protein